MRTESSISARVLARLSRDTPVGRAFTYILIALLLINAFVLDVVVGPGVAYPIWFTLPILVAALRARPVVVRWTIFITIALFCAGLLTGQTPTSVWLATLFALTLVFFLAIELAKQRTALEAARAETEVLFEATKQIASSVDLSVTLRSALEPVLQFLKADLASIRLFDDHTSALSRYAVCQASWLSDTADAVDRKVSLTEGIGRLAIERAMLINVADFQFDRRDGSAENTTVLSAVAVPLQGRFGVVGVLVVSSNQLGHFTTAHERLLLGLSDQVALAIEHSQGIEEPTVVDALRSSEDRLRGLFEGILRFDQRLVETIGEEKLRGLFEGVPIGLYRTTPAGKILDANPAMLEMLGYPDLVSVQLLSVLDLYVDSEDRSRQLAVLESGRIVRNYEMRLRRRDGTVLWVDNTAREVRDAAGTVVSYDGSMQDVTERKLIEEAHRISEAGFRLLFEANPHPMCVYDRATLGFLAVNDAALQHYGYSHAEFLRLTVMDIRTVEANPGESSEPEPAGSDLAFFGQRRHRHRDGRVFDVDIASHAIEFAGRQAVVVVAFDITERLRLEDQLRQAQKMEAIGKLAGGIAHDFNNLLTVINGYGELLHDQLPARSAQREAAAQILQAGESAASLTRQLLAFSRRQIIAPRLLDLNVSVEKTGRMLRRLIGENIMLDMVLAPVLGLVKADPGQIEQVLVNLVTNARDAMPRGGILTIATANTQLEKARIGPESAPLSGPFVTLSISDTGLGMDSVTISRIFEPFFTTKDLGQGTGLGLSAVYGIVTQSGGVIDVRSEVGLGTTFQIYLPLVEGSIDSLRLLLNHVSSSGKGTILLVEDEKQLLALSRMVLEASGFAVLTAESGEVAIKVAAQHVGEIDLLLADVHMPGLSGRDVAKHLRALHPKLSVLFTSGINEDMLDRRLIGEGRTEFIQKPFTPTALADKVRHILNQPSTVT